jgi:hypothetical protein
MSTVVLNVSYSAKAIIGSAPLVFFDTWLTPTNMRG